MAEKRECEAPECTNTFEAQRSTARYCGTTCRQRAARFRKARAAAAEIDAQADVAAGKDGDAEHELVTVTRRELVEADVLDTVNGQLALNLARKLVDIDAKGVAALTRELAARLDAAKGTKPAAGRASEPAAEPEPEDDDQLTRARKAREAKARQAAESAT